MAGQKLRWAQVALTLVCSWCAVLVSGAGIALSAVPVVTKESVTSTGVNGATLTAQVNPGGLPSVYHVDYGTTLAYGSTTSDTSIGAGTEAAGISVVLTNLQAATTYHARVVAENKEGSVPGGDLIFITASSVGASSSTLPDNRAFEMVSPVANQDANIYYPDQGPGFDGVFTHYPFQAASDGKAVTYAGDPTSSGNGNSGGLGGNQYVATRAPLAGWSQVNVTPHATTNSSNTPQNYMAFSQDLSVGVFDSFDPLTSEAPPAGYDDLYTRTSQDGAYRALVTTTPPNRPPFGFVAPGVYTDSIIGESLAYAGASSDFRHLLFEANDALPTEAGTTQAVYEGGEENNLYESVEGRLRLVNVLPGGGTKANASFGSQPVRGGTNPPNYKRAISSDGSRIFWTDLNTGNLYVRENATTTVQIDASQILGSGGGGQFQSASVDGSRVFFTDCNRLTSDSTAVFSAGCNTDENGVARGNDLYEYDMLTRRLTDLTVDSSPSDSLGADVQGVVGASADGSYVYFVADGALSEDAVGGQPNLYMARISGGQWAPPTLIATLLPSDNLLSYMQGSNEGNVGDWQGGSAHDTAGVTPDGLHAVFVSSKSLTNYPNSGLQEIYVFEAKTHTISCASCDPGGAPPPIAAANGAAALLPLSWSNTYVPRWISSDGSRVFFDSLEPLVPQDVNGTQDVYEWESDGAGSCSRAGGCIYLLSGGAAGVTSYFTDASENGDDVFIVTRAQLVPADENGTFDLYDVRVGGTQPAPAPACTGTGCQGVPGAPPIFATPASVTFTGVGNFAPPPKVAVKVKRTVKCKKGFVKKKGKCVRQVTHKRGKLPKGGKK